MEVKKYKMARSWLTDPDSGNSAGQWKNFVKQRADEWKARQGFKGAGLVEQGPAGVRQGYAEKRKSPTKINEDLFKKIDDLIAEAAEEGIVLGKKGLAEKLGYKVVEKGKTAGQGGINKVIDAYEESRKISFEFKPAKLEGTEIAQKIIDASKDPKYIKKDGTPNIKRIAKDFFPERKLDDARKVVRGILVTGIDYEGKKNIPGEITSAKQSKKNALENIKIAQKKAGIETTKQADQVIDKILSQNEVYQKMSVEDIAKDKDFLKRLRVEIDPITGSVNYNGYTKLDVNKKTIMNDLELAQHAKNKAGTYELFTPDHITPKAWRKQNVGYPINFQSATYMENSQLDNGRRYLMDNPNGNIKPIDNYLKSQNQTIRFGKNKYGFKLPIVFNSKTGTSNIVELSVKKTIPIPKGPVLGANLANIDKDMFDFRKLPGNVRHFADIAARYGAKSSALMNILKKTKGAGKWTGLALAAEPAFAAPFAEYEYKMGESPERMLGSATWGLFGETEQEELKKATGELGYATQQIDEYSSSLDALGEKYQTYDDQNDPRSEKRKMVENLYENTRGKYNTAYDLFVDESGEFNEDLYEQGLNNYTAGLVQIDKFKKQLQDERVEQAGGYDNILQEREIRAIKGYAGGGMAGIRRPDAVPPVSGPDPQGEGLSYLLNRVRKE